MVVSRALEVLKVRNLQCFFHLYNLIFAVIRPTQCVQSAWFEMGYFI